MAAHERFLSAIDAHFAGRGGLAEERALRAHCDECADCHRYYERHLLLAQLDPGALSVKERLGRGLGLVSASRSPRHVAGFVLAAAAALLFWVLPASRAHDGEFLARGTTPTQSAKLEVYQIQSDGTSHLAPATIHSSDELAFAYGSSHDHSFLMVFGVDEHGHVFWYHPEWNEPKTDPAALAVSTAPGTFELPAAVAQALDGQRLNVFGLFSDQALHVRAVESVVASARVQGKSFEQALREAFPGAQVAEQTLSVLP
jgi:hypothetical protein